MIITDPKKRKIMNSIIDNVGFYLSMPFFILAIVAGDIVGFSERKYKDIKNVIKK